MRQIETWQRRLLSATIGVALASASVPAFAQMYEGGYPGNGGGYFNNCETDCGVEPEGVRSAVRVLRTEGARYEYIVVGPRGQADAVAGAIAEAGGTVIRTHELNALEQTTQIATFPQRAAYDRAIAMIGLNAPESSLALHHAYGFAQARSPRVYAPALIGEDQPGRCRLREPVTIGMIDGPVNTRHPALSGVDLHYDNIASGHDFPSADHGTAVAVLLAGDDPAGLLSGFARGARLMAVSVFSERDSLEEAGVERIAQALDILIGQGVRLINLSIAGPENAALARALTAAARRGAVLVAASGNERRPRVAWPAAAPEVIAVTAVDAARRRFSRANTGVEVEFAAPGVDVYAARDRGAGYVSGTSFAAPIVTALVAREMARGARSLDGVRARLRAGVEPLGLGTRNTEFGWGLVKAGGC